MNDTGAIRIMAYDSPQKNHIEHILLIPNNLPDTKRWYNKYLKGLKRQGFHVEVEHVSP